MSVQELIEDEISEIESALEDVRADFDCLESCEDARDLRDNLLNLLNNLKTASAYVNDALSALKEKQQRC